MSVTGSKLMVSSEQLHEVVHAIGSAIFCESNLVKYCLFPMIQLDIIIPFNRLVH